MKSKLANLDDEMCKWQWFYKNGYHERLFSESGHDRKKTWRNINRLLGTDKSGRKMKIEKITVDGVDYVNDRDKASILNDFFV